MNLIDIIIKNSSAKEAKLYSPAKKAFTTPETGITIQNKSAYNVIKDMADITIKYLPIYLFGLYANPFETLKGKATKEDIIEFINASKTDLICNQLLVIMLSKIIIQKPTTTESNRDDPYGENIQIKYILSTEQKLCKAFGID